jgi:hypothetical protein
MSRLSARSTSKRASGSERVFADDLGRLWSASPGLVASAMIFTCISDGRQSGRAIALEPAMLADDVGDDTLRAWLGAAPRIGTLS